MGTIYRPLKIRKRKGNVDSKVSITIEAVSVLIDSKTESLQNQIKILQSNAITTMVILGDIRNSAALAASSTESTKRRLEELLSNIDLATDNIKQYVGVPQNILSTEYSEPHTMQESLNEYIEDAERPQGVYEDTEGDDVVENVSEEYEDYAEWGFVEADRHEHEARRRRRRT